MQAVRPLPDAPAEAPSEARSGAAETPRPEQGRPDQSRPEQARPEQPRAEQARPPAEAPRGGGSGGTRSLDVRFPELAQSVVTQSAVAQSPVAQSAAPLPTPGLSERAPRLAPARPIPAEAEAQLGELARLTGYRLEDLGGGVVCLKAELGPHGYSVLVARDDAARRSPAWTQGADYRVQVTSELERPEGVARLTREALVALIEHARLAPLSPVDLRGYWKAGHVDLESAASVAELVSSHLAQRGAFSFVLLTLSQQPAHSVVSVPRLAERLGSGVNFAELGSILDTLSRAPFLALTPLPGGQYLLRVGVSDLLTDMAEYADGVRRRVRPPVGRDQVLV